MTRKALVCSVPVILVCAVLALSCGGDAGITPQEPVPDYNQGLQDAWNLFRSGHRQEAENLFTRLSAAYPGRGEPRTGLGWCLLRRPDLPAAIDVFNESLAIQRDPDAYAGIAVAASALGLDSLAVAAVVAVEEPAYLFVGDPTLSYIDLTLIRAVAEFHLMRWEDCRRSLLALEPSLDIDLGAWDFREQLLAAIEQVSGR